MDKKVAIIVLNWNGGQDTIECIESLQKLAYPNYKVIIVDNASTDGSPQLVREKFPELTLIQNETNLGFAEGNNVGIRYALGKNADYILLLNNDTVVDADLLTHLVKVGESDLTIGILGPKIYYYERPKEIWFAGGTIDWDRGQTIHLGQHEEDHGQYDGVREVDYITGCAFMVKSMVCKKIGLMDPRFYLYFEETDWCVRAKDAGYKVVFVPEARVWHKAYQSIGGLDSPSRLYYFARNNLLFMRNSARGIGWYKFVLFFCYYFLLRQTYLVLKGGNQKRWKRIGAQWCGVYDFITGKFGEGPKWLTK